MPIAAEQTTKIVASFRFEGFELRPLERTLLVAGREVSVGSRAFDLLVALMERSGRVAAKAELIEAVWPNVVVEEGNLQVQISTLRRLIGPSAIATIPGRGYRLTAVPLDDHDADGASRNASAPARVDASTAHGNVPRLLMPMYGREAEVVAISELLARHRLVTIVGSGGIGKTCLAEHVAHSMRSAFRDGAWVVELGSVLDPALFHSTVARALRIALPERGPSLRELLSALLASSMLVVLDNCEHLLPSVIEFASLLMREIDGIRILATSQEPLRIDMEALYRLPPLEIRRSSAGVDDQSGAIRLFVERAKALDHRFALSPQNEESVANICEKLDGIPLAIEFAAARVAVLGVHGVEARLSERFRLLGGTRREVGRYQTLHAALDWSVGLLAEDERIVLRRLAIFAGSFTIEDAQAIAADEALDEWAILECLSTLVDKSLVLVDGDLKPRYRLLETTKAYAIQLLSAAGEVPRHARRHAEIYEGVCRTSTKARDMDRIMVDLPNLRAAFQWAMGQDGVRAIAVGIATYSAVVLAVSGLAAEALQRLQAVERFVDDTIAPDVAARYWQWLGRLGIDGRLPVFRCAAALSRAEGMFAAAGNRRHLHACLRMRAEAILAVHEFDEARVTLAAAERMEDDGWPLADVMRRLRAEGLLAEKEGATEAALEIFRRAHGIAVRESFDRYVLVLLNDMARVHLLGGHADEAAREFRALVDCAAGKPSETLTLGYALCGLMAALTSQGKLDEARSVAVRTIPVLRRSGLLLARGDIFGWLQAKCGHAQSAARFVGACDAHHYQGGTPRDDLDAGIRDQTLTLIQRDQGAAQVEAWLAEGAAATEHELVDTFIA